MKQHICLTSCAVLQDYSEHREGDQHGNMRGEYSVALPDGRIQHVKYHADSVHGNVMEVTYEGEAHHPDLQPEPVIPPPPPPPPPTSPPTRSLSLGARFERDASSGASPDFDDYDGGFVRFSDDIKPFIDFGFGGYLEQDQDRYYDDYEYDYYDLVLDRNNLELIPSPRRQRSLQSLLNDPLFREYL